MLPRLVKLGPADAQISRWSGGTTAQLAIWPPEAVYAERTFLWRVSSAVVELETSDFTPLPDYDRLICTLRGEIRLSHNGGAPVVLRPYQVHAFSGADRTRSAGRCTDFNLMLRRGRAEGEMRHIRLDGPLPLLLAEPADQLLLCCAEGACSVRLGADAESLRAGEYLLLNPCPGVPTELSLVPDDMTSPANLILCRMRQI